MIIRFKEEKECEILDFDEFIKKYNSYPLELQKLDEEFIKMCRLYETRKKELNDEWESLYNSAKELGFEDVMIDGEWIWRLKNKIKF